MFACTSHTAVEPPRDRRRVASQLFPDCTAVVLRRHGGDGGCTAVIVRCHGGHGGAAATPLRIGDCSLVRRFYSPKVRKSEIKGSSFRRFVSPNVRKSSSPSSSSPSQPPPPPPPSSSSWTSSSSLLSLSSYSSASCP